MGVPVSVLLGRKGSAMETVGPEATIADAAMRMAAANVGSVVVVGDDGILAGLLSERDVVRQLAASGPPTGDLAVSAAMTTDVQTCHLSTNTDHLMQIMTEQRVRHVPVVDDDRHLVGIVSIGDVVKWQIEELSSEAAQLGAYVRGAGY